MYFSVGRASGRLILAMGSNPIVHGVLFLFFVELLVYFVLFRMFVFLLLTDFLTFVCLVLF